VIAELSAKSERGTVLLETIVVGFTIALLTLPILLTIARLSEASGVVSAEARSTAEWVARHGTLPDTEQVGSVTVESDGVTVTATSTLTVDLVSINGSALARDVSASFTIPVSPYRSDR
jgi:hypothetical protein